MIKYVIIYTDLGDTCDNLARVLGTTNTLEEAQAEMTKDVNQYLRETSHTEVIADEDIYRVVVDGAGCVVCQWQILKIELQPEDFLDMNSFSKSRKQISFLHNAAGDICTKLQVNDWVKFDYLDDYDQHVCDEGVIERVYYDQNDNRENDCYLVRLHDNLNKVMIVHGGEIDQAWR